MAGRIKNRIRQVFGRTSRRSSKSSWPDGLDFFSHIDKLEQRAARQTDHALRSSGKRAPETYEQLGTVLLELDCVAACYWQCREGDHLEERIVGRVVNGLRAAVLLMYRAYYDEALASIRNAGEAVNLLFLFEREPAALAEWKSAEGFDRWNKFKPGKVRKRLARDRGVVPLDSGWYEKLSTVGTHVDPTTNPQAHNLIGIPTTGGHFQPEGALLVLNEIARVAACATYPAALLVIDDAALRRQILESGKALLEKTGAFNIDSVKEYREQMLDDLRRDKKLADDS